MTAKVTSARKIYVIGTVHNMMPRRRQELQAILEEINPDQILVEIVDEDLLSGNLGKYPKEMVYAYRWGISHQKKVRGFDAPIDVVKKSISPEELKNAENEAFGIFEESGLTWKDLNRVDHRHVEEFERLQQRVIDYAKLKARYDEMLENVGRAMIKRGIVLILTGAGNLELFEGNMKEAIFPLRDKAA